MSEEWTLEDLALSFGHHLHLTTSHGLLDTPQDIRLLPCGHKLRLMDGTMFPCWVLRVLDMYWDDLTVERVCAFELVPYSLDARPRYGEFRVGYQSVDVVLFVE